MQLSNHPDNPDSTSTPRHERNPKNLSPLKARISDTTNLQYIFTAIVNPQHFEYHARMRCNFHVGNIECKFRAVSAGKNE